MLKRNRPKNFNTNKSIHSKLRRKWRSWLPPLKNELSDLFRKKEIFWELQEIANENPQILKPYSFFDWMCRNYIIAIGIGIRKFTDQNKKSHSLWIMLYQILENPGVINRRSHSALYDSTSERIEFSNNTFSSIVGDNKNELTQTQVRSDLRTIEDKNSYLRRIVNKKFAHFNNPGAIRNLPTFNDVDKSLECIDEIFCKYNALLTTETLVSVYATPQYDWTDVLMKPWIGPNSKYYKC